MIFLSTPTQETDAISALGEDLKELQEFGKPDVLMDALKGWVPDLIRFGLNLLVILVIFIVGRKIIRLLLKMGPPFLRAGGDGDRSDEIYRLSAEIFPERSC